MNDNRLQYRDVADSTRSGLTLIELLVVIAIVVVLLLLLLPSIRVSRETVRRTQCQHNLRQIGLALLDYHDDYDSFPPPFTVDADGNRLHSWRTLILPYLDQSSLYEQIDLTRPWDDPANSAVSAQIPAVYSCPSALLAEMPDVFTVYLGVVSDHSFFRPASVRTLSQIPDKEKVAVVEVDASDAVHWMSPHDADEDLFLNFSQQSGLHHHSGMHVINIDSSVRFITAETPEEELREMITVTETEALAAETPSLEEVTP